MAQRWIHGVDPLLIFHTNMRSALVESGFLCSKFAEHDRARPECVKHVHSMGDYESTNHLDVLNMIFLYAAESRVAVRAHS